MFKIIRKVLIVSVLVSATFSALADGVKGKSKNKLALNIATNTTLRNSMTPNLKSGLVYTGSLGTRNLFSKTPSTVNTSIVSYQKGNMIYVIPVKQKVVVPEIKQGYTGMKLIIRPH